MSKQKEKGLSIKDARLIKNFGKTLQELLSGKGYRPLRAEELIEKLSISKEQEHIFQKTLTDLLHKQLIRVKNGRFSLIQDEEAIASGILRVHPRGFGFLQPDDRQKYPEDIFIPKHLTLNAVDGDEVEVLVNTSYVSEKGPEGRVISILNRGRTHIAGTIIKKIDQETYAYVPLLGLQQRVLVYSKDFSLKMGDRVILKVLEWGNEKKDTTCELSHYIGHISDPSCDIKAIIEEYELPDQFPDKVLKEVAQFGSQVPRSALVDRLDLRNEETFTIDPDTAKDFDDAVSVILDNKGHFHLNVHIADVSHYVKKGSELDKEAHKRCNSTYFPGTVIPMLPHELSSHLCSLKADVNRLTISVLMEFDQEANLLHYKIARSVIRSQKRFTYKEAKKVLDGTKKSKHAKTLHLMVDLCHRLKKKRYERGSIEFSLPDTAIRVDEEGNPLNIEFITYDITHQMIEEFMLKANEVVATHLSQKGIPLPYRIHQEPDEENVKNFAMIAEAFGFHLSHQPTAQELQTLFEEAKDSSFAQYLATCFIRSMKLAQYSPNNIGHYGLGLDYYCHFTSPIRRYIDLMVHRALFEKADEQENLEEIALQCSEKERLSARAENSVVLLKKLRLLDQNKKSDPYHTYEAIITQVKQFGFAFEVLGLLLEGFIHVADLNDDYFIYDESRMRLKGKHTHLIYMTGDRINVLPKSINLITLEAKWELLAERKKNESGDHKRADRKQTGPAHRRARKKRMGRRSP